MENWFSRQRVVVLSLVVVLAGAGTYFYQRHMESKDQEGKAALYKVQKVFEEELKAIPEAERAPGLSLDVDVKFSKTVAELKGLIAAKSAGAQPLFEAAFRLGTLYLDFKQPEKAAAALSSGIQFAKSGLQKASMQYLLGSALEQSLKLKEALSAFQEGMAQNVGALKADLLLAQLRTHVQLKELDQAKKISEELAKDFPGSKAADSASRYLKEAK